MRVERLAELASRLEALGLVFAEAGFSLYLVGGIVRDAILGSLPPPGDPLAGDYDLTTEARPDEILRLVRPLASALWTQGERFGTIGATIDDKPLEITTHRAEVYDPDSRQPTVSFGNDLETDLSRRDFTINAMALSIPSGRLVDPYGGERDLATRTLRTPLDPETSFSDDPLRMLRAARFIPRFALDADQALVDAARGLAERLSIVSVERVHDEFERLLGVDDPSTGLEFALATGLLDRVVGPSAGPWLEEGVRLVRRGTDVSERRARFLAPGGAGGAGGVLSRLRYSTADRRQTLRVLVLIETLVRAEPSRPALRRALDDPKQEPADNVADVRSAVAIGGDLHPEDADRFVGFGLLLESMVDEGDVGPFAGPLDGRRLMEEFDLAPGPEIGELTRRQKELIIRGGEMDETEVLAALRGDQTSDEEC